MAIAARKDDAIRAIDGKVTSLIGFSGAVATVLGLARATVGQLPASTLAAIFFTLSIVACLATLFVRQRSLPSPSLYSYMPTLKDPKNKARIAVKLAEAWVEYSAKSERLATTKANLARIATILFVLGTVSMLFTLQANSLTAHQPANSTKQVFGGAATGPPKLLGPRPCRKEAKPTCQTTTKRHSRLPSIRTP